MMTSSEAPSEPTAARQVLETPELLEMIISPLPHLEVLVLQRVSKMWHGVITNSPSIQRKLFLRPDWNLEANSYDARRPINRPGERPRNNIMLRRVLDGRYPNVTFKITNSDDDNDSSSDDSDKEEEEETDTPSSTFDLPNPNRTRKTKKQNQASGHWSWDVNITYPADNLPTTNPALLHPNASWRKMYICQPPCTALHVVRRWQTSSQPAMQCAGGITMDFFIEQAAKARETWRASDRDWHYSGPIRCSSIQQGETKAVTREVVYDEYVLERLFGVGYLTSMHG